MAEQSGLVSVTSRIPRGRHEKLRRLVASIQDGRRDRYTVSDYVADCIKRCMDIDYERFLAENAGFETGEFTLEDT